jgi:hypothetical protein
MLKTSATTISKPVLLVFFVLLMFSGTSRAQYVEYSFNQQGSPCYFRYICYSPRGVYNSNKQPFLFILGKQGESALETYTNDTLKDIPGFYNYLIVYVPNRGANATSKLQCLDALSSLLTYHYGFGKSNLFLKVNDEDIRDEDIQLSRLNSIFSKVILYIPPALESAEASELLAKEFEETYVNYDFAASGKKDDLGTYYFDETLEASDDSPVFEKPVKTYFGKPQTHNYTLSGIIRDKISGETLPFANIMVRGTGTGASANADGHFTLLKVPSDTSVLIVQYIGYNQTEVYLTPFLPKKNFNIELRQSVVNLKAVSIIGKKEEVVLSGRAEVSSIKMTPRKMESLPALGEKDILRSFQLMPGISASNESSSGLYVRGGTPDQNLVLYDGFTVYHVDHLYGFFSAFNSNALKDVTLHKGGFESRFGGRLSSVTEITGKDGNQKKINFGGDLSLLSMNFFAEVPVGEKFSSVFTFRRSYKGALYNKIFEKFNLSNDNSQETPRMGPGGNQVQEADVTNYFYDLTGKLTFRPNEKDIISLSFFNGTDKLDNGSALNMTGFGASGRGFNMNTTDITRYGNTGSSLKWARKWNEKLYGSTIISYSNYFSNRDRTQERNSVNNDDETITTKMGVIEDNNLNDYSFKTEYQWDLLKVLQLQAGAFISWYNIDYSYAQNDTANLLEKRNEALLSGLFLQAKIKLAGDKLNITPGLRTSIFQNTSSLFYEPRLAVSYDLFNGFAIKASTGKFYQFANRVTREDILSGSRDFWLLSDGQTVPVSSAVHYIAGLSYETNNYLFSTELYYKQLSNITEYSLRFNASPAGVTYNENFYSGSGKAKGIEFLAQKKSGVFNGWVSYTLGEAMNQFDIYSDTYYAANQDVTHEFKVVGMYNYRRWDFSATWIFASGRPYTAPSGAYSITLLDGTEKDFFTVTAKNGIRLPDYHRFDIAANYKLLRGMKGDKRRQELGYIGVSLFNVYNRKNVWYKTFTIEDGSIIETNVNYLGITPNLTLSLKLW